MEAAIPSADALTADPKAVLPTAEGASEEEDEEVVDEGVEQEILQGEARETEEETEVWEDKEGDSLLYD